MHRRPLVYEMEQFLRRERAGNEGLVAAVSGGADSVALVRALAGLRPTLRPQVLAIAHLNHQLRGADSDADEEFVRRLYLSLRESAGTHLEWRSERVDVAAGARVEGGNLESFARRIRYDWLTRVARESGLRWVATGHNANDQAETVLHRLLRGTGLKGLRGIAARRALAPEIMLIRPLLRVPRTEVLAFLDAEQQPFREDRSNVDRRFTRNRIRHELVPLLAGQYNPACVEVLSRLAEQAAETYANLSEWGQKLLAEAELPRAGRLVVLDRQRLAGAPRNLVREAFRLLWDREDWPLRGMSFAAWDRLAALAVGEIPAVDLPGGIQARGAHSVVQVGPYS